MAQLVVRNLDDSVKVGLRRRAERHGRTMEAEVRAILQAAVSDEDPVPLPLGSRIAARFAEIGIDEEIREHRGTPAQAAAFE